MNVDKKMAPDGGWGWMCVLGSSLSHLLSSILIRSYGIFYLYFLEEYGQSASATSWVGAINMLAWGLFGPVASALSRRFSCRTTTCVGAFLLGSSIVACGFAPNFISLFFLYTLSGVGMSLSYTPGYIIVGHYFDKRRATAMSLSTVGAGLGAFAYPPILQYLYREYGYRGGMLITGAVLFNAFVSAALYRPFKLKPETEELPLKETELEEMHVTERTGCEPNEDEKYEKQCAPNGEVKDKLKVENYSTVEQPVSAALSPMLPESQKDTENQKRFCCPQNSAILSQFSLLKIPLFLAILLLNFGGVYGMQMIAAFMPALAIDNDIEEFHAGLLLSIMGITDTVSRLTTGFFLDIKFIKPYRVYLFTLSVAFVGVVATCVPLFSAYGWYVFLMAVRGFFGGVFLAHRATIMADLIGAERAGDAFGFILVANACGSVFGRVSGGIVKDKLGRYEYAYYIAGVFTIFTTLILFGVLIRYYRDQKRCSAQTEGPASQNI